MSEHSSTSRGASARRQGPSRQVRLRRTVAGAVILILVAVVTVRLTTGGDDAPVVSGPVRTSTTAASSASTTTSPSNEDGSTVTETVAPGATKVPQNGTGKISVVPVPKARDVTTGRAVTYTVEVEGGLGVDVAEVATTVQSVLLDPRGWQKVDGVRFVNVSPEKAANGAHVDVRVTLASPGLTDKLCAPMRTLSQVSCWNGERSVLNFRRWALGDDSYGSDVTRYRVYQVNHEVGHGIGHQHLQCPGKGKRAPVMVQQTLDLGGCTPWPYPSGA